MNCSETTRAQFKIALDQPAISVTGLRKSFHGTQVLPGIDLTVQARELTVLR